MAAFTGPGKFTLTGNDARLYDFDIDNNGGLEMQGSRQRLEGNMIWYPVVVADNSRQAIIVGNVLWVNVTGAPPALTFAGRNHSSVVVGNVITDGVGGG